MRVEIALKNEPTVAIEAKSFASDEKHLYIIEKINSKADFSRRYRLNEILKITVFTGEEKKRVTERKKKGEKKQINFGKVF